MKQTIEQLYETAQGYVDRGFSVIPLHQRTKIPKLKEWKSYQSKRPTKFELQKWFSKGDANIGIVTGEISNIVVVDIDTEEALNHIKSHNIPKTPTVNTAKGQHMYYAYKPGLRNFQNRQDFPGIDFRGDGGYVVAPPSIHETGVQYLWVDGRDINSVKLAALPEIFLQETHTTKSSVGFDSSNAKKGVFKGQRNKTLASLIGHWINKGFQKEDVLTLAAGWNTKNDPPMSNEEVDRTLQSVWQTAERKNNLSQTGKGNYLSDRLKKLPEQPNNVFIFHNK